MNVFLIALHTQTDFGLCGCSQLGEAAQMSSPKQLSLFTVHFVQHLSHRTGSYFFQVSLFPPIAPNGVINIEGAIVSLIDGCPYCQETSILPFPVSP